MNVWHKELLLTAHHLLSSVITFKNLLTQTTPMTKKSPKQINKERIEHLFEQAYAMRIKEHALSNRYVFLARKLSAKAKVRIPQHMKRLFCKQCGNYFIPGKNYTVRTTGKTITYTCKSCGKWTRLGYKKRKNTS